MADPNSLPEWRQSLPGEKKYLDLSLGRIDFDEAFASKAVSRTLQTVPEDVLLLYLPHLLAHLEYSATMAEHLDEFEITGQLLKTLFCRYRPSKLRFLTLCMLGKHKNLWKIKLEMRSDAYTRNEADYLRWKHKIDEAEVRVQEEEAACVESFHGSELLNMTADLLLHNDENLREWVRAVFLHPSIGVEREEQPVSLRTEQDCFSESDAVLYIMEKVQTQSDLAQQIGARMVQLGLIFKVTFFPVAKEFGRGKNYYRSSLSEADHSFGIQQDASVPPEDKKRLLHHLKGRISVPYEIPDNSIDSVRISTTVYVDQTDMQSVTFWRDLVFSKKLKEKDDFGWMQVIHPLRALTEGQVENQAADSVSAAFLESLDHGGVLGDRVYVNKVFSSVACPGIVSVQVAPEASFVELEEKGFTGDSFQSLDPKLIVKEGDNLMQDMNVEIMFRVFNHFWRTDKDTFPDEDKIPFSYTYDVFPTGLKAGCMEVVTNLNALNHYTWQEWVKENGKHSEVRDLMLRSAAGSSVAAYVLGARDRHWDNICIKDHCLLLHIDFGFVLGTQAPLEGPRFSISPDMEKAFTEVGIWEPFIDLCANAFMSLKRQANLVMREAALLFRHTGVKYSDCLQYMAQKDCLNIETADAEAMEYIRTQVRSASGGWKTKMRSFAHNHVDPVYYTLLKKKFPPALLADMIVEKRQAKQRGDDEAKGEGRRRIKEAIKHPFPFVTKKSD